MDTALGIHCLIDLSGVAAALLGDSQRLEDTLVAAAQAGGARVLGRHFHAFEPQGTSGVVILAESHLAIHTWPERSFAAVDVFTCGEPAIAQAIADQVVAAFAPARAEVRRFERRPLPASPAAARVPTVAPALAIEGSKRTVASER